MRGRVFGTLCCMGCLLLAMTGVAAADWRADYQRLTAEWKEQAAEENLDFAKAKNQVEDVWTKYQEAEGLIVFAEQFGEERDKLPRFKQQKAEAEAKMLPALRAYVALAPEANDETKFEQAENFHRLAVMLYQADENYRASAAVSEHLARRFPDMPEALAATNVALNCYAQLYNKAPTDQRQPILLQLMELNAYIADTWKDRDEGRQALSRLAQLALQSGDAQKARQIATRLPQDSPQRGEIQLQFALQDYNAFVTAKALPEGDANRPSDEELAKQRTAVMKIMREAVDQVRKTAREQVAYAVLASEYALATMYSEDGEIDESLGMLERKDGLLDSVNRGAPAENPNFPQAVYNLALNTYVSKGNLEKALQVLDRLAGTDADPAQITSRQLNLANRLLEQLKERWAQGDQSSGLVQQRDGLAQLLTTISQREAGHSVKSRTWVAQALFELADSADPKRGPLPDETVQNMYKQAGEAYEKLLGEIGQNPGEAARINWSRIRMANIARRTGDFAGAIVLVERVLRDAEKNLDAQFAGASTFQDWGVTEQSVVRLRQAIEGGPPRRTAVGDVPSPILGWARLVQMLQSSPAQRDRFFEARYNLALTTRNLGLLESEAERKRRLDSAKRQILGLYRGNPDMGGPEWKERFEALLRSVQTALGERASGLEE